MARRKARLATVPYLERVAIWYLERYSGSVARVRRTLKKRVDRAVEELEQDRAEAEAAAEATIERLRALGYLDDRRLAVSRVAALRKKGSSRRKIIATLHRQGIERDLVEAALAEREDPDEELVAAQKYVLRRRLGGHHRPGVDVREARDKDLGKLARAGFSYSVARAALDASLERDSE